MTVSQIYWLTRISELNTFLNILFYICIALFIVSGVFFFLAILADEQTLFIKKARYWFKTLGIIILILGSVIVFMPSKQDLIDMHILPDTMQEEKK